GQLRFGAGNNRMVGKETIVHQFAMRLSLQQFSGIAIEDKIDTADVNAEMVRLGQEHAVGHAAWDRLMRVTGYENSGLGKFGGQRHRIVRKIVPTSPRL